ncbi:MAG: TatD family hydrolase [Bacteroidales bacterium]|nr:TatD family hydrolase [Bacteroidales bacterium]
MNFSESYINIHTHHKAKDENVIAVVDLSSQENPDFLSERYVSYGIHPWHLTEENTDLKLHRLQTALQSAIFAIGEVGLDKLQGAEIISQEKVFQEVILLSEQYQKSLIIHCVKAWEQLLAARKMSRTNLPWIVHGFHGSKELARQLLEHGLFLSFGESLLRNISLQSTFSSVPLNKIFLETDDADMSIEDVYICAAKVKNISLEGLKQTVAENFITVFNLK